MNDFDSVFSAAQQLSEGDRLRLIDALWNSVPADSDFPLSDEWVSEIERRLVELDAGTAVTVPWSQVRDEALARIRRGKAN